LYYSYFIIDSKVYVVIRFGVFFLCEGCSSELVQAVDCFLTSTPHRKPHPAGTAKGCRGAARDILVVTLAGHNNAILTPTAIFVGTGHQFLCSNIRNYIIKMLLNRNYLRNKYFA